MRRQKPPNTMKDKQVNQHKEAVIHREVQDGKNTMNRSWWDWALVSNFQ